MELAGTRCRLRSLHVDDHEAFYMYVSDTEVTRLTTWETHTRDQAGIALVQAIETTPEGQPNLALAITPLNDDQLIGVITLAVTDAEHRRAEIGYGLRSIHWRRGIGTDAIACLSAFALARGDIHRLEATCHPDNVGSAAALQRAGFTYEGRLRDHVLVRGAWRDSLLFARLGNDR